MQTEKVNYVPSKNLGLGLVEDKSKCKPSRPETTHKAGSGL